MSLVRSGSIVASPLAGMSPRVWVKATDEAVDPREDLDGRAAAAAPAGGNIDLDLDERNGLPVAAEADATEWHGVRMARMMRTSRRVWTISGPSMAWGRSACTSGCGAWAGRGVVRRPAFAPRSE